MNRFKLYGTSACHLCDVAAAMLEGLAEQGICPGYDKIDISDSDDLFQRYGLAIPVLRSPAGEELNWPFDVEQLRSFIARE